MERQNKGPVRYNKKYSTYNQLQHLQFKHSCISIQYLRMYYTCITMDNDSVSEGETFLQNDFAADYLLAMDCSLLLLPCGFRALISNEGSDVL